MTPVFLDTIGLLALWDASDQWHVQAARVFEELKTARRPLLTTTFILLECGNAAARRSYRQAVSRLREHLATARLLVHPTEEDETSAWTAYQNKTVGDAGIVDHVSFTVMARLGLKQAFTNDRHFRMAGFETLF